MAEVQNDTKQEEHVHGDNCQHDHDHKDHEAKGENETTDNLSNVQLSHKKKKEEKKFVKIMKKQNLKQIDGITRVTLRTTKNLVMYIDNPIIMTSNNGNSYVIFGEP